MNTRDTLPSLNILTRSVLEEDSAAIFTFGSEDVCLPMTTLEEMEYLQKGEGKAAQNAKQLIQFLQNLTRDNPNTKNGIPLSHLKCSGTLTDGCSGRLFFQEALDFQALPKSTVINGTGDTAIKVALALKEKYRGKKEIILVTRNPSEYHKASTIGLRVKKYENVRGINDLDLISSGVSKLPMDFWDTHGENLKLEKSARGTTIYKVKGPLVKKWHLNQFLYLPGNPDLEVTVRSIEDKTATLETVINYRSKSKTVYGITALEREQNFAFNALLDPNISLVFLLGDNGTGKTLTSLAAGLEQVGPMNPYRKAVFTRSMIPLGPDPGLVPGDMPEKIAPWTGPLLDAKKVLNKNNWGKSDKPPTEAEKRLTEDFLSKYLEVMHIGLMQGKSFQEEFVMIDESQEFDKFQMRAFASRLGQGSKIVFMGNLKQIANHTVTPTTSGLTHAVECYRDYGRSAHIVLATNHRDEGVTWLNDHW